MKSHLHTSFFESLLHDIGLLPNYLQLLPKMKTMAHAVPMWQEPEAMGSMVTELPPHHTALSKSIG